MWSCVNFDVSVACPLPLPNTFPPHSHETGSSRTQWTYYKMPSMAVICSCNWLTDLGRWWEGREEGGKGERELGEESIWFCFEFNLKWVRIRIRMRVLWTDAVPLIPLSLSALHLFLLLSLCSCPFCQLPNRTCWKSHNVSFNNQVQWRQRHTMCNNRQL